MKSDRHDRILEIITHHNIETQEELAEQLRRDGYEVTQATISRDIRQLKLTKVVLATVTRNMYPFTARIPLRKSMCAY